MLESLSLTSVGSKEHLDHPVTPERTTLHRSLHWWNIEMRGLTLNEAMEQCSTARPAFTKQTLGNGRNVIGEGSQSRIS